MKTEYRFKSSFITKSFPIIWIIIIIFVYFYSMMSFINQQAYSYMLIYSVIFIFFIFMFRYFYIVYFLKHPVLVVDTKQLVYRSLLGLKTIPFTEISKIEKKFTFFVKYISVISENNSPINIPIEKFNDSSEDIYNLIMQMYNSSKNTEQL